MNIHLFSKGLSQRQPLIHFLYITLQAFHKKLIWIKEYDFRYVDLEALVLRQNIQSPIYLLAQAYPVIQTHFLLYPV